MQAPLETSELNGEQAQASSTPTLLPTTVVQICSSACPGLGPRRGAEQRDSLNARDRQEGIATEHSTAHAWSADSSGNFSPLKPVRGRVRPSFRVLTLVFPQVEPRVWEPPARVDVQSRMSAHGSYCSTAICLRQ
jgi:hypothetical protein